MTPSIRFRLMVVVCLGLSGVAAPVELVSLTPQTYDGYVPAGKEVDAIFGDYALVNDAIVAVVADPLPTRNANMMTRNTGGCLIDLTTLRNQSDQLGAYYPSPLQLALRFAGVTIDGEPVDILFLLVSPPNQPGDHLRALENISRHLKDEQFVRFLRQAKTREHVLDELDEADQRSP